MRHARPAPTSLRRPVASISVRGVRTHPVRFALSITAVALGVAFVTGALTFRDLLADGIERTVATTLTADLYVRAPTSSDANPGTGVGRVPVSLTGDLTRIDGVAAVAAETSGPAALLGADDTVVDPGTAPSLALDPRPDPTTRLVAGSWPTPGEIVLESSTARASGLTLGDETTVVLHGVPHSVRVSGEFSVRSLAVGTILVGLDGETAHAEFAADDSVPRIGVHAEPGTGLDPLADRIADVLDPQVAEVVPGETLRADASESIERSLGFVRTFLVMFAAAALIAGGFVIANAFAMAVRERAHEFAVLRAVGAAAWQILASVLAQAAVIGALGSAAGVAVSGRLIGLLRSALSSWGSTFSGDPTPSTTTVVLGLVLGTLMSTVAAALPALRAARTPPVESIRADMLPARRRGRTTVAVVLLVAGAALLLVASRVGSTLDGSVTGLAFLDRSDPQTLLLCGAAVAVAGVLLAAPALVRPLITALAWPVVVVAGPLGRLARGNLARDARRTANTAGGLLVGMALVVFTGIVAESTRESLRSITDNEIRTDLIVGSATGPVPPEAVDIVRATTGVTAADTVREATTSVHGADGSATVPVAGVGADTFDRALDPVVIDGGLDAAFADGGIIAVRGAARAEGWAVGDRLRIGPADAPVDVEIGAVVDSHLLGSGLVVPDGLFDQVTPEAERIVRAVYVTGTGPVADLRAELTAAVAPYLVLTVRDRAEAATTYAEPVNEIVAILYGVLALSVVIALLGIVNTLALSVIERTREIGLLRAVGVGTGQLGAVIALEAVLTSVLGTLLGAAAGIGIGAAVPGALADRGMTAFAVPWPELGATVGAAVVIGLTAAVLPAWRAARIPVLTAVATS